jgi:uncharacterized OB-fold protein
MMEIARHWRLSNQRYKLQGSICNCCGKTFFAPRVVCDACSQSEASSYTINVDSVRRENVERVYATGK